MVPFNIAKLTLSLLQFVLKRSFFCRHSVHMESKISWPLIPHKNKRLICTQCSADFVQFKQDDHLLYLESFAGSVIWAASSNLSQAVLLVTSPAQRLLRVNH